MPGPRRLGPAGARPDPSVNAHLTLTSCQGNIDGMDLEELIRDVERRAGGEPLDRLAEAASLSRVLGEMSDHLLGHFVDRARGAGASWAQVGGHLGVSKQAAQQRFVVGEVSLDDLTNRASVVLLKAQDAARERGEEETTSAHLVLAMLGEWSCVAGLSLESVGVGRRRLRRAIGATLPPSSPATLEHRPWSPGMRRTLELARRRRLRMGHPQVGTEHLLLGLLDAGDQPAVGVLTRLSPTEDLTPALEAAVSALLRESRAGG